MRSAYDPPVSDLTPAARIRDAALALFAEHGSEATSVRAIAAAAGVSAPSVIRIYGSKDGLRQAVDDHLLARINDIFESMLASGSIDEARLGILEFVDDQRLLGYLARALSDDTEAGRALFDRLYTASIYFIEQAEAAGFARPVADRAATAAWLLAADMGVLFLRHHLGRVLGADPGTRSGWDRIAAAEFDLLTTPYFTLPDDPPNDPPEERA